MGTHSSCSVNQPAFPLPRPLVWHGLAGIMTQLAIPIVPVIIPSIKNLEFVRIIDTELCSILQVLPSGPAMQTPHLKDTSSNERSQSVANRKLGNVNESRKVPTYYMSSAQSKTKPGGWATRYSCTNTSSKGQYQAPDYVSACH